MVKRKRSISRVEKRQQKISRILWIILALEVLGIIVLVLYFYIFMPRPKQPIDVKVTAQEVKKAPEVKTGKIITEEAARTYSIAEVQQVVLQTNKRFDSPVNNEVTRQTYAFTSSDGKNDNVPVYARIYLPAGVDKKPIFAFAPGTTGIADQCAASLEDPVKRDWSNYESLMMAYASQGYATVIIDYEGMRDPKRMHHYMVGELEGKALLDSIRSLKNLPLTQDRVDTDRVFTAGYSQGGHASFWADQLKDDYAPELKLSGAIGYGPVTSVEETLDDATNGANINWFGPLVLTSYSEWYKTPYPVDKILLPHFAKKYTADSQSGCIDSFGRIWPNNIDENRSGQVYTPEFMKVSRPLNIAADPVFANFAADMAKNIVGNIKTDRPKLINHGIHDNVVLVSQSQHGFERMCVKGNTVSFKKYDTSPNAIQAYNPSGRVDHYQTMNASFKDTYNWMQNILNGQQPPSNCQ